MGDNKTFAYFNTKSKYDQLKNSVPIDNETIVFVGDNGKIYTQGKEFGGQSDTTYTDGDYIKILNNSINVDYTSLKNRLSNDGLGNGTTYTGVNGINISNGEISADMPYIKNNIGLSLNNLVDVEILSNTVSSNSVLKFDVAKQKWTALPDATSSGEGVNGKTIATYPYFKNIEIGKLPGSSDTDTTFKKPMVNDHAGWSVENLNPEEGFDTWIIWITLEDGLETSISNPINLTNGTGENNLDNNNIEWIYLLRETKVGVDILDDWQEELNTYLNTSDKVEDHADVAGKTWYDHPQGITERFRYEYESYRTNDGSGWSQWSQPVIRSAWGEAGRDGDGVEYIFCLTDEDGVTGLSGNADPSTWISLAEQLGENFQQREYIPTSQKGRLDVTEKAKWYDEPKDMSLFGLGTKQWVSSRKYNGETKLWEDYSSPALWSYNSKDGIAEGYTYTLDDAIMPVATGTEDNTLNNFSCSTSATVLLNGQVINNWQFDNNLNRFYRTDGKEIPQSAVVSFTTSANENHQVIHVSIQNLPDFAGGCLICPVDILVGSGDNTVRLAATITIVGIHGGVDGLAISLKVSTDVIHTDYLGNNRLPNTIAVWALNGTERINPGSESDFTFKYRYDRDVLHMYDITTTSIDVPAEANEVIQILLFYKNIQTPIDAREIRFVKDGAPAIGPSQYSIEFINGNLQIDNDVWDYTLHFKASKKGDEDWEEIVTNEQDSEQVQVYIFGNLVDEPYYEDECWNAKVTVSGEPETKFAVIYITTASGMVLQSLVIPIVRDGVNGTSPDPLQPLSGTVMRFTNRLNDFNWNDDYTKYYDGNHVDENQIKYLDIVQYKGEYYAPSEYPVNTLYKLGRELGVPGDNPNWRYFNMLGDAAFNAIIAKTGFIDNLTAEQIVITRGSGNETKIVAGMANERYLNGAYNSETGEGNTLGLSTENGVRIWAGQITNGNVASAPFTVDELGHLKATNAEISGAVVSNSQIVGGTLVGGNIVGGTLDIYDDIDNGNNVYIGTGKYSNTSYGIIYSRYNGNYPLYVGYSKSVNDSPTIINALWGDGSGKLASGNIEWDVAGNLVVKNISFSGNAPTITNDGNTISVSQRYNVTPTIIALQKDVITLPDSPEGTVFNILVISTAHHDSGNSVQIKCVDGNDIHVYYSGAWHNYAENDTFCQEIGMYHFVKKGNIWYSIFPY